MRIIPAIVFLLLTGAVVAQPAGSKSFSFLTVPAHARLAALGGVNVSLPDRDVNFVINNPALLSDTLAGSAAAGYLFYLADVGQATFTYAHRFDKVGLLAFAIRHINYGELTGYDASGMETGSFRAGETELLIGKNHRAGAFRFGVNLKGVFSNFAGFRGSALLADFGGTFVHPRQSLVIGLAFRNFGFMLNEFSETSNSDLPFDVQLGASFRPEHMPLRFSLTLYDLSGIGKEYNHPLQPDKVSTTSRIMRHINMGAEILLHKNVTILAGYNSLRQQQLKNGGGSGFTVGFSAQVKHVECVVSRASYSAGNAAYAFTLIANTKSWLMKRKEV